MNQVKCALETIPAPIFGQNLLITFRPNQSFIAPVTKLKAVIEGSIHAHKFSHMVLLDINANEYGEYIC